MCWSDVIEGQIPIGTWDSVPLYSVLEEVYCDNNASEYKTFQKNWSGSLYLFASVAI